MTVCHWVLLPLMLANQATESVVITPESMAEHGFYIEVRSWETSEQERERHPAAEVSVRVRFDPDQGPTMKEFLTNWEGDGTLVVRNGDDVLVTVPVDILPWLGNDGGFATEFTVQQDLLEGVKLVLYKDGVGTFTIDVDAFLEKEE